jgi:anhydro-N-acetylmuramic acid kinase
MSGTSLDGLDIAHMTFVLHKNKWEYQLGESKTIPYSLFWQKELKNLSTKNKTYISEINKEYGKYLSKCINDFVQENKLNIDLICSHGHTIFHEPQKKITLQIGDGKIIAKKCQKPVVFDFRSKDVELGGQGAPLVPVGDHLLFSEYKYCLNLGGFSNFSFHDKEKRIAFDISPLNVVLNKYSNLLGYPYDDKGNIARSGLLNKELFDELNQLKYYHDKAPKSLGMEWVNENFIPIVEKHKETNENILRTCLEHFAFQIGYKLENGQCLLTGGGAFNTFLIERINHFSNAEIIIPEKKLIEFKEALVFGFLGVLKLENQINCYKSVTGAKRDSIVGEYFAP